MKRFTFLAVLVALLSVTAFAQKSFTCIDRHALSANDTPHRIAAEQVTPPATATVETWYTTNGKFIYYGPYGPQDFTSLMPTIQVAIEGADIYIQGLSSYFPDGWIKGAISGNTATFDNYQCVGEDKIGAVYFCGADNQEAFSENIVFNYDAEAGILEAVTIYLLENGTTTEPSPFAYWIKPTFSKTPPETGIVTPPETLVAEEWAISYTNNKDETASGSLKIGFDGNDVYLQGFCSHLPKAWMKGTLTGTTITFLGKQYFGFYQDSPYSGYDMYLQDEDVVFTYDAEANKMTAVTGEITIYTSTLLKSDIYKNAVITKVIEKATTPATPNISQIYDSSTGPVVLFTIPMLDVDGNAMAASKLSFQFLSDVEQELNPITFSPADYDGLTDAMNVFPYGFTDGAELFPTYFYLKQTDYNTWNRIGLQTIYIGGGEENRSEIFWHEIKPYEKTTFDFNAMEVECSSNDNNKGDIIEDRVFTEKDITLTISPMSEGAPTPNRFWSTGKGPQLRLYSGTLTFMAANGKVITKMVFNNAKWNDGNSANTGSFEGNVWTGKAQKVVVTIAGNTQLNSIEVYPTDYVPTAVMAPEGLVTDTYTFKASSVKPYYDPAELTLFVKVGFDGDDAYIQGLAADANENANELWVKATKNKAGQYVIPANQFMGNVQFWMSSNDYFFTAVDGEGKMIDTVLDFDAGKQEFTTAQTLVLNQLMTEVYAWQTFTNVVITKFNEVAATPAAPTINNVDFGEWSHGMNCSIPTEGTNGETLNPQKLFYTVWIEKVGQQTPYTFLADMYWSIDEDATEVPYATNYSSFDGTHNIYFQDDAAVFDTWTKVGIQSIYYGVGERKESSIDWKQLSTDGISNVSADMNAGKAAIFNIAGQRIDAPQKGVNIINGRKVVVK